MANSKSLASVLGEATYNGQTIVDIWNHIKSNDAFQHVSFYDEYHILDIDRWDGISQKFYNTPHLWWLIANYNKIKDPFKELIPGNTIKIIKVEVLIAVMHKLKGIT